MITFFCHLRVDGQDRLRNLQSILNYYSKNIPGCKFVIVEDDIKHNTLLDNIKWPKGTALFFMENKGLWHKTRALNEAAKNSKTDLIVQLDIDCIFNYESIQKCADFLNSNEDYHFGFPYNGYIIDVNFNIYDKFEQEGFNYQTLMNCLPDKELLKLGYGNENLLVRCTNKEHLGVGGIVMFKKDYYLNNGGYNPNFYCWGCEDNEIVTRFHKLGLKDYRITDENSIGFHLPHRNAIRHDNPYYEHNRKELSKIENMNIDDMRNYIQNW
jgi:hypothetical protein